MKLVALNADASEGGFSEYWFAVVENEEEGAFSEDCSPSLLCDIVMNVE